MKSLSRVQLFATPWTVAYQAPPSMEYWNGLPFPSPEDLPNPGMKPTSLVSPTLAGRFFTTSHLGNLYMPGSIIENHIRNSEDFYSGPVVKTSPPNTGLAGSNPV